MPKRNANLLWKVSQGIGNSAELQTLTTDDKGKPVWVTVAHGTPECMKAISRQLSESRYKLMPLNIKPASTTMQESVTRRVGERKPAVRIEDRNYGSAKRLG